MRSILRSNLVIAMLLAVAPAMADGDPSTALKASRLQYQRAISAAEAGKPEEARKLLLELWEKQKTFDVANNLAELETHLHEYEAAAEHARAAIAVFPPSDDPKKRKRLVSLFDKARSQVGTVTVAAPTGAEVKVDGRSLGKAPLQDVFVKPGKHRFEASNGTAQAVEEVTVAKGKAARIQLKFPADSASGAHPPGGTGEPGVDHGKPHRVPIIAGSAAAAIGLGIGIGFAIDAKKKRNDAWDFEHEIGSDGSCGPGTPFGDDCDQLRVMWSDRDQSLNISTWSFAIAGTAAAATLAYVFWPRGPRGSRGPHAEKKAAAIQVAPATNGLWVSGRF